MKKKEFGDFQTPLILTDEVSRFISTIVHKPSIVVEPTCGLGNFIKSNLSIYKNIKYFGLEINQEYVKEIRKELKEYKNIDIQNTNFFTFDWEYFFKNYQNKEVLIIGNPPWVNNSDLSLFNSKNIPIKSNFQNLSGLEAKLGKANFDIAEWILIKLIVSLNVNSNATIALLCKTITARKVLKYIWSKDFNLHDISLHNIDSKKYFNVSVDACLFVAKLNNKKSHEKYAKVYDDLNFNNQISTLGFYQNEIYADIAKYLKYEFLNKKDNFYQWRSGLKHDASKIMELTKVGDDYYNGFNEKVDIEETFIYPLLKSSDISKNNVNPRKYVIVTQKYTGEDTNKIKNKAPKTWKYLLKYSQKLNNRKSIIYKKQSQFAIFGIGNYSFSSWKIAISGLYKNIHFTLLGTYNKKPIMLDDTCYFISCKTQKEAKNICNALNSNIAKEYLESMIFFDSKRPIKVDILKRLNIYELLSYIGKDSYNKSLELTSEPVVEKSNINDITYIPDIPMVAKQTVHL